MGARIKQSAGRWEQSQSCSPASCSCRLCCLFTSPSFTHKDRVKLNLLSCAVAFKRHTKAWKDAAERPDYGLWGRISLTVQTVLFLNLHYKEAPSKNITEHMRPKVASWPPAALQRLWQFAKIPSLSPYGPQAQLLPPHSPNPAPRLGRRRNAIRATG